MKVNPFSTARAKFKTIGQVIDALTEAFSAPGSADTMGAYMIEQACEEVLRRRPQRQVEFGEIMARIDKSLAEIEAKRNPVDVKSPTYADTLEAEHELEGHFKNTGEPNHSAGSQVWVLELRHKTYSMQIIASSNVPKYLIDGEYTAPGIVYAALLQI